ncbi:unnamed protein product [Penicillium pancosmium]
MEETTVLENEGFARWVIDYDDDPSLVSRIDAPIRLEGGTLVVDEQLRRLLGIEKVIWVPGRRNVDLMDVYMDAEARFIRPGVIVFSKPHDTAVDLWKEISIEIYDILKSQTDAKGRFF